MGQAFGRLNSTIRLSDSSRGAHPREMRATSPPADRVETTRRPCRNHPPSVPNRPAEWAETARRLCRTDPPNVRSSHSHRGVLFARSRRDANGPIACQREPAGVSNGTFDA
ncbi:hypothetical protein GCM10009619_21390 [Williamsia maris]